MNTCEQQAKPLQHTAVGFRVDEKELFLCSRLPGNKVLFGDQNIFPFMVQV